MKYTYKQDQHMGRCQSVGAATRCGAPSDWGFRGLLTAMFGSAQEVNYHLCLNVFYMFL